MLGCWLIRNATAAGLCAMRYRTDRNKTDVNYNAAPPTHANPHDASSTYHTHTARAQRGSQPLCVALPAERTRVRQYHSTVERTHTHKIQYVQEKRLVVKTSCAVRTTQPIKRWLLLHKQKKTHASRACTSRLHTITTQNSAPPSDGTPVHTPFCRCFPPRSTRRCPVTHIIPPNQLPVSSQPQTFHHHNSLASHSVNHRSCQSCAS